MEINSEGQISILGTGGKAGGRGAIRLLFKHGGNSVAKVAAITGDDKSIAEAAIGKS